MSSPLPRLLGRKELAEELGVSQTDGSDVAVEGVSRAGACCSGATWALRLGERGAA